MKHLVMVSKSTWSPAIRREHALAGQAKQNGVHVDFIEAPADIRSIRSAGWLTGLRAVPPQRLPSPVSAYRRSTIVPGHRHPMAAAIDNRLLGRTVRRLCPASEPADRAVVVNVPWQWEATAGVAARRVFDAADNWNLLLKSKRPHVRDHYRRIAAEADAVVVANHALAELFPNRQLHFVPNGTEVDTTGAAVKRAPGSRRMVYVGTFSERFDVELVSEVLTQMPDWALDLYGESRYAGRGTDPAPEFGRLLDRFGRQVTWHGVLQRADLGAALNGACVALVPHRAQFCRGQSSMKFLDYAARGCPVVSTRWEAEIDRQAPPGVWFADDTAQFVRAVRTAADIEDAVAAQAISWAKSQTWERRWPAWAGAVFGAPPILPPDGSRIQERHWNPTSFS